jgi:methyl-accepting chemotaxis protein
MAIFAIVILAGAIIVVIRGFLLRPLEVIDRRLGALADGEPAEPIEGSEKFCAEMQSLAGDYDRLRARKTMEHAA